MMGNREHSEFQVFLNTFRTRALAQQINRETLDACLHDLTPLPEVLERQSGQAEFALSLHDYMARLLTGARIRQGRAALNSRRAMFNRIAADTGVEAGIIAAIWGVESNFGHQRGTYPVIEALATLAWRGRRNGFFEAELIAALKLVQDGHVAPANMRGSWAGAMGHGQFMPSSARDFAIDYDGDGRADIWHDDPVDGLASIGNYLARHGWQAGAPWGLEASLPKGFDLSKSGADQPRATAAWQALGITLADGRPPPDHGLATLLLPAGINGPAFLTYGNFRVLLRYNNAHAYALAIGSLSDLISGGKAPHIPWPVEHPLTQDELRALQVALSAAGFNPGSHDGLSGPDTTRALRAYQQAHNLPADGHPSKDLLIHLS